ncbi:MAG: hypothetical protein QOF89_3001 [Acidobacteriota bacterium]|jgi:hypothetical protein|nr:hypothetical protein [Acidobacteriota bacterium]
MLAAQLTRAAVPVPGPVRASFSSPGPVAAPAAIPGAGLFHSTLRLTLLSISLLLLPILPAGAASPPASAPQAAAVQPPEKTDTEKQRQTIVEMRDLGTALFSWLTDQVGAAAAGQQTCDAPLETKAPQTVDIQEYPPISMAELEALLIPQYIEKISETDGWGNPYEVRVNVNDVESKYVLSIRSPGRDGVYSSDVYTTNGFDPKDYDQDLVWADGFFVRWPQKTN